MPSFAIHNICGVELLKKFNISLEDKNAFIIGNVLPDVSRVRDYNKLDDHDKMRAIQKKKVESHFRKKTGKIIEYPDCNEFLKKYENDIRNDIVSLAYFFHLYTDYYYFKYFLLSKVKFYDVDMNETEYSKDFKFVKILKNDKIMTGREFFDKDNEKSLYKEYGRCNRYLSKKYNLSIDCDELIQYVDEYGFLANIDETNSLYAYYAIHKLRKYVDEAEFSDEKLSIFDKEDLDYLVDNVIESFIKDYGYLLDKYN